MHTSYDGYDGHDGDGDYGGEVLVCCVVSVKICFFFSPLETVLYQLVYSHTRAVLSLVQHQPRLQTVAEYILPRDQYLPDL